MAKYLVSGAAGFLGSHLCEKLLSLGHEVIGIDSLVGGFVENVPEDVDFIAGDCNNLPLLKRLMAGVDTVYHLAATAHEGMSVFSPHENAMNGYAATTAMVSAAAHCKVKRFIFTSSMARYGKQAILPFTEDMICSPVDPYGIGKYASELVLSNLAKTHGMESVILVPHNIIGRRQAIDPFRNVATIMINLMMMNRRPYIYGDGSQQRCFSFVDDCIDPLIKAAVADINGETINIGPDDNVITILDLFMILSRLLDFKQEAIFIESRPSEVHIAHCSADKARRLLNYQPKISLIDGLKDMIAHHVVKPFQYHLELEIDSPLTPKTWKQKLF